MHLCNAPPVHAFRVGLEALCRKTRCGAHCGRRLKSRRHSPSVRPQPPRCNDRPRFHHDAVTQQSMQCNHPRAVISNCRGGEQHRVKKAAIAAATGQNRHTTSRQAGLNASNGPPLPSQGAQLPSASERPRLLQHRLQLPVGGLGGGVVAAADEGAADKHARHAVWGGGVIGTWLWQAVGSHTQLAPNGRKQELDPHARQDRAQISHLRPPVISRRASWIESPSSRLSSCVGARVICVCVACVIACTRVCIMLQGGKAAAW
jgi:hypothetical protein